MFKISLIHTDLVVAGIILVVALVAGVFFFHTIRNRKKRQVEKFLKLNFGEPMYSTNFSIQEVQNWINKHKEAIKNGNVAIVFKVNNYTLGDVRLANGFDFSLAKYLVIAIANPELNNLQEKNSIIDSLLVKYSRIDIALEKALSKGNGILIVKGDK